MLDTCKFDNREAASAAAAERIAGLLAAKLDGVGKAMFVVSGGATPAQCFDYLSRHALPWDRIQVALSDERWVPAEHGDSNERLVRETLLQNAATAAGVLPVYREGVSIDERCVALQSQLPPSGFACSLVGMGIDGHFASLFADTDGLETGLNPDTDRFYMPVETSASEHARASMTLGALLRSDEILLLFFGAEKFAIYEQARAGNSSFPITALLQQQIVPVSLYWAP